MFDQCIVAFLQQYVTIVDTNIGKQPMINNLNQNRLYSIWRNNNVLIKYRITSLFYSGKVLSTRSVWGELLRLMPVIDSCISYYLLLFYKSRKYFHRNSYWITPITQTRVYNVLKRCENVDKPFLLWLENENLWISKIICTTFSINGLYKLFNLTLLQRYTNVSRNRYQKPV